MVPQTPSRRQDVPAPQFGMSQFTDLAVAIMRALSDNCDLRLSSQRCLYFALVLHADCYGDVIARARDIAAVAGLPTDTAQRYLRRMRASGHISMQRIPGSLMSRWHINALRVGRSGAA